MITISIITACLNSSNTIGECLQSVKNQRIPVEHIIVDGASSDSTLEVVRQHDQHITKIFTEPDEGIYDAMNKGLKQVSGDVIGILNADDYYPRSDILERVIKLFDNVGIDACYGDIIYFGDSNPSKVVRYWRAGIYNPDKFYRGWMPPHPTFFVRRSVYEKYGVFNLELGTAADYELMLRFMLKHRIKVAYIPEVLVHMRTGGVSNVSLRNRLAANKMDRKAWSVNGLRPYPWTLWLKPLRKVGQWFAKPPNLTLKTVSTDDSDKKTTIKA